jgi:ribonuclease R
MPNTKPGRKGPQADDTVRGPIQFRAGGSAFVIVDGKRDEPSVQIAPDDPGVALPGDTVVARIYRGVAGKRPGERVGRVVEIVERGRATIVGDLRREGKNFFVVPDDPRFVYEIAVPDPSRSKAHPVPHPGDKVVVRLGEWRRREQPLMGEVTERLGRTHEPRAELLGIFIKHGLEPNFPADVEREAAAIPDRVGPKDIEGRLDYRKVPVFTIDPDDAKDFDDALSIEHLDGGDVRVGIHVADVSTYVRHGTAIDREARTRGNSTYLVGTVIPMLPEKLSNGLCSLVEAQDRLCKAVFLTFGTISASRRPISRTRSSAAASASPTSRPTRSSSRTTLRRSARFPSPRSTRPAPPAGRFASSTTGSSPTCRRGSGPSGG